MKLAFWGLFVVGFVLCSTVGIGPTLQRAGGSWTAPAMIVGSLLGLGLVALAVMFATGVRPAMLSTDLAFVVVLAVLIGAKVAVSLLQVVASRALA